MHHYSFYVVDGFLVDNTEGRISFVFHKVEYGMALTDQLQWLVKKIPIHDKIKIKIKIKIVIDILLFLLCLLQVMHQYPFQTPLNISFSIQPVDEGKRADELLLVDLGE